MAQSYRFAVTRDATARAEAWRSVRHHKPTTLPSTAALKRSVCAGPCAGVSAQRDRHPRLLRSLGGQVRRQPRRRRLHPLPRTVSRTDDRSGSWAATSLKISKGDLCGQGRRSEDVWLGQLERMLRRGRRREPHGFCLACADHQSSQSWRRSDEIGDSNAFAEIVSRPFRSLLCFLGVFSWRRFDASVCWDRTSVLIDATAQNLTRRSSG